MITLVFRLFILLLMPALASAHTVTDLSGRRINVEKPFSRIISLYGAHTENLFSLGLDTEIIGVSVHDAYPPEALERNTFSYHDDAEKFMAVQPDLVLIRPMIDRVYKPFVQKLEQAGISVVSLQPVGMDAIYSYWRDLGALTGRKKAAEEMIRTFQNTVGKFRDRTRAIRPEKRKKVYFEAIHSKMKTFSKEAVAIFVLETAGGVNIADNAPQMRKTNIAAFGKERILDKAGEIDVYLAQKGPMNPVTIEIIRDEPGFSAIRAVKEGHIHLIDEMLVSRPTMRLMEGIQYVYRILYGDGY